MITRVVSLVSLLACSACFSPGDYEPLSGESSDGEPVTDESSSGTTAEPDPVGDTDVGTDTGTDGGPVEEPAAESSSGDEGFSTESDPMWDEDGSSSTGDAFFGACGDGVIDPGEDCDDGNLDEYDGCDQTCALETCGYALSLFEGECHSGAQDFCVPDAAGSEIQAACEACTGVPCEEQVCSLGFPAGAGTIWTPVQTGGGFIEHPMGFVDVEIRHSINDVWPRGTILADACSTTPIGAVGL